MAGNDARADRVVGICEENKESAPPLLVGSFGTLLVVVHREKISEKS